MKKLYLLNPPTNVCPSCLNGVHKLCRKTDSGMECRCKESDHDDSAWRVKKQAYDKVMRGGERKKPVKSTVFKMEKKMASTCKALCRWIIKEQAHWHCELEGKDGVNCSVGRPSVTMQWAHIISRGASKTLKYDLMNAVCLCTGHHKYYTHKSYLWDEICKKHFPEKFVHSYGLKWQKTQKNFSLELTLSNLAKVASEMKERKDK